MNILVFTVGVALFSIGMVNCRLVRRTLRDFKQWAIDNGWTGAIIYGCACGVLVGAITFPWGY